MVKDNRFNFIVIIVSFISILVLVILYNYLIFNSDFSNSKVLVSSNVIIDRTLSLDNDFYLLYDGVDAKFLCMNYSLIYTQISSFDIVGRNMENRFEIVVSEKFKDLLNKSVSIKINNDRYNFLVVGVYKSNNIINDKYIYTSKDTLEYLYNYYNISNYNYIFIVNDYDELNTNMDLLRKNGYIISILGSEDLDMINNYNIIIDSIILFVVVLLAIIILFIIHMIL